MIPETEKIQRGWYYVVEQDPVALNGTKSVTSDNGTVLTVEEHGSGHRIIVTADSDLPWVALLRVQSAIDAVSPPHDHILTASVRSDVQTTWNNDHIDINRSWLCAQRSRHPLIHELSALVPAQIQAVKPQSVAQRPTSRVLFFESLMNSDMEYNDAEISQGVLHMVSSIDHLGVTPVFAKVKMPIEGDVRPVEGLESLTDVLADNAIGLICISLLEGYWEGVIKLIARIRELGSRARIAVGGVMPTLTPEHVAAHLPDVSFVCRGAGEYFLPKMVQILGDTDIDTPLSQAQLQAFAQMDGIIVKDQSSTHKILVCGKSANVMQVESLDTVKLNLDYIRPHHIVGGVEIATSRGCIHRCTFCNIIGRESYQARSAESMMELLQRYEDHYRALFGDRVPSNAWRLHLSDDDFACDKPRAAQFFKDILNTPFRLSSVQVSVADLCKKENGRLVAEIDRALCDTIVPECFADYGKDIPAMSFIEDHKPRNWSSFLQIGVETFCDNELIRLGKGYRVEHIRSVVEEMAGKGVHVDAYFIQSNADTSAEDLLDGLMELVRLKLAHPIHFHVRYPPVPHLVSYFPSATHRRYLRRGQRHVHKLMRVAAVAGYPEFDYPFVEHDIPSDTWVNAAISGRFFSGENCYTQSLTNLFQIWSAHYETIEDEEERARGRRLLRLLDDLPRTLLFQRLVELRYKQGQSDQQAGAFMLALAQRILGPADTWAVAFQRFASLGTQRMVLIPTWQCELRCKYCYIRKQDGRVMPWSTSQQGIDLLMTSRRDNLILQFFGGEALMEWETVQRSISYAAEQAQHYGKNISFVLSSNGWSLSEEKLDWLNQFRVKLELSLDGDTETQNDSRKAFQQGKDSYVQSIATKTHMIQSRNFFYDVIMVVPPKQLSKLSHNFIHIAEQGWTRIQINYALGMKWTKEHKKTFADELMTIAAYLKERWAKSDPIAFINLESEPMNMRLNGEITVDWDGTLHSGNAFLLKGRKAGELILGRVDDLSNFDRYWLDVADNEVLLDSTYSPEVTANNLEVGKIFNSFIRWMRSRHLADIEKRKPSGPF